MKFSVLFSAFLLLSFSGLSAQKNGIVFRASHFFTLEAEETVETVGVELPTAPTEYDKTKNIRVDISYLRKLRKSKWFVRFGYDKVTSVGEQTTVSLDAYSNLQNQRKIEAFRIGAGFYHPIIISDDNKAFINFSIGSGFGYQYLNSYNYTNELHDGQGAFLGSAESRLKFANSWSVDLDFGVSFYYYFFKRIGLGIEANLILYYNRMNGTTNRRITIFDEKNEIKDEVVTKHQEKKTIIGKTNPFSISIAYEF